MEDPNTWPPAPKIDSPEVQPKPSRSIWVWVGFILVIVVLGGLFLTPYFIAALWN